MSEKDKLQIIKDRYKMEGKRNDQAKAAKMARVTPPNLSTGLSKDKWKDLTESERKGVMKLIKILNQRKKENAEFETQLNS